MHNQTIEMIAKLGLENLRLAVVRFVAEINGKKVGFPAITEAKNV
jgi:hypothetical protein